MLSSPETPGISPETPGFEDSGRNSGYRPGNSGFWDTPGETPGIGPETPDFRNPDIPVLQSYERRVVWLVVFVIG